MPRSTSALTLSSLSRSFLLLLLLLLVSLASAASISPWPAPSHDSGRTNAAPLSVPLHHDYCVSVENNRAASLPLIPRAGLQLFVSESDADDPIFSVMTLTLLNVSTMATVNLTISGAGFLGIDPMGELRLYAWTPSDDFSSALYSAFSLTDGSTLWQINVSISVSTAQIVNTYTDTIDVVVPLPAQPGQVTTYRIAGRTGEKLWGATSTQPTPLAADSALSAVPVAALPSGDVVVRFNAGSLVAFAGVANATGAFTWASAAYSVDADVSAEAEVLLAQDNCIAYWNGSSVLVMSTVNGSLLWQHVVGALPLDETPALASVSAFGRTLLALQSGAQLLAVEPATGHIRASYPYLNAAGGYSLYSVRHPHSASVSAPPTHPQTQVQGAVFAGTYNEGFILRWDVESGHTHQYKVDPGSALAIDADGTIYVAYEGTFSMVALRHCLKHTHLAALIALGIVGGLAVLVIVLIGIYLVRKSRPSADYTRIQ